MDAQQPVPPAPPTIPPKRQGLARRLVRLVVIGVAAVVAALAWPCFFECRPVGSGPAGPAVPREAFAKPWTAQGAAAGTGRQRDGRIWRLSAAELFSTPRQEPRRRIQGRRGICLSAVLPNLK